MEQLNEFANWVGFGTFKGMVLYFLFLGTITLFVFGIYYGQKQKKE